MERLRTSLSPRVNLARFVESRLWVTGRWRLLYPLLAHVKLSLRRLHRRIKHRTQAGVSLGIRFVRTNTSRSPVPPHPAPRRHSSQRHPTPRDL
ncbi:hypothetical protein EVAR_97406_1 [Eumeta japonica]|uniref:Uncharacterized protein n=1 Tax=Eumeta variegata TaxID=151549 RepID=A0A4C1X106_EUMVA|nr:hypothetical protein EVAR_97406_1 [Eumeta japonica]